MVLQVQYLLCLPCLLYLRLGKTKLSVWFGLVPAIVALAVVPLVTVPIFRVLAGPVAPVSPLSPFAPVAPVSPFAPVSPLSPF